jgi:hypothetical protein
MAKMLFSLIEIALLVAPSIALLNDRAYYASQGIVQVPVTAIVSHDLPNRQNNSKSIQIPLLLSFHLLFLFLFYFWHTMKKLATRYISISMTDISTAKECFLVKETNRQSLT